MRVMLIVLSWGNKRKAPPYTIRMIKEREQYAFMTQTIASTQELEAKTSVYFWVHNLEGNDDGPTAAAVITEIRTLDLGTEQQENVPYHLACTCMQNKVFFEPVLSKVFLKNIYPKILAHSSVHAFRLPPSPSHALIKDERKAAAQGGIEVWVIHLYWPGKRTQQPRFINMVEEGGHYTFRTLVLENKAELEKKVKPLFWIDILDAGKKQGAKCKASFAAITVQGHSPFYDAEESLPYDFVLSNMQDGFLFDKKVSQTFVEKIHTQIESHMEKKRLMEEQRLMAERTHDIVEPQASEALGFFQSIKKRIRFRKKRIDPLM